MKKCFSCKWEFKTQGQDGCLTGWAFCWFGCLSYYWGKNKNNNRSQLWKAKAERQNQQHLVMQYARDEQIFINLHYNPNRVAAYPF